MFQKLKESLKNLRERWQFEPKLRRATPVLIYQMGKVGSSSIYHPLKKAYAGHVIHIHQFNEKCWYWDAREMFRLFSEGRQRKFKVISLIREPIGRNLSEFFHRFRMYNGKVDFDKHALTMPEIRENFLKNIDHDYPLDWFDENFKKHFGIDVYEKPFPDAGFDFYKNGDVEVLLMKHDLPNSLKDKLVAEFLGLKNFEQEVRNVGENKEYKATYSQFKKEVRLPNEYLARMAGSRFFRHFYSAEFIEKTVAAWRG